MSGGTAYELTAPSEAEQAAAEEAIKSILAGAADSDDSPVSSSYSPTADSTPASASTPATSESSASTSSHFLPFGAALADIFSRSLAPSPSSADLDPALGPLGRGIVDAIGGLSDAAQVAAEMYLSRAVQQLQLENPCVPCLEPPLIDPASDRSVDSGWTAEDALDEVLPDMPHSTSADGLMQLQLDVNLKRFPCARLLPVPPRRISRPDVRVI
jgi:hypothetical protein